MAGNQTIKCAAFFDRLYSRRAATQPQGFPMAV